MNSEHKEMILELLDCEELNAWEYDFINDLACFDYELSERQVDKLEEIYGTYYE